MMANAYYPEPGTWAMKAVMHRKPRRDIFPTTDRSWIASQLDQGPSGLSETNHHVMSVYAEPLKAYYNGSSFYGLGDADELVAGFFADRLGRSDYLDKWQSSGRKLRHWLIVGFRYYLMEQRAARKLPIDSDLSSDFSTQRSAGIADSGADAPEQVFHREVARSLVRQAIATTENRCIADGLAVHWRAWVRHVVDGCTYVALADELGHSAVRLKVMARTVSHRFRQAMREQIAWPGADPQQLDEEIQELIMNLGKDDD